MRKRKRRRRKRWGSWWWVGRREVGLKWGRRGEGKENTNRRDTNVVEKQEEEEEEGFCKRKRGRIPFPER